MLRWQRLTKSSGEEWSADGAEPRVLGLLLPDSTARRDLHSSSFPGRSARGKALSLHPKCWSKLFFDVLALSHTALILLLPAGLAGSHRWGWRFGLRLAASFQPISAVPGGVCRVQVMRRALGEALLSDDAGLLR